MVESQLSMMVSEGDFRTGRCVTDVGGQKLAHGSCQTIGPGGVLGMLHGTFKTE